VPPALALPAPVATVAALTLKSLKAWAVEPGQTDRELRSRQGIFEDLTEKLPYGRRKLKRIHNLLFASRAHLTSLPDGLHVEGDLDLRTCTSLLQLPKGLSVEGDLNLQGCTSLAHLSDELKVHGNLNLWDCTSLTQLSDGMRVEGNLNARGCTSLTHLAERLNVQGNLDLRDCHYLKELSKGLHVGGNLTLAGCSVLTRLTEGLSINGDLDLRRCNLLAEMPEGLHVQGDLELDFCRSLTQLPKGLHVGGSLMATGTPLHQVHEGLRVGGHLLMHDCADLTQLPERLHVGGSLELSGCSRLIHLPDTLDVGGNLNLRRCRSLTQLPQQLRVGGDLILQDCTALAQLPEAVLQWPARGDGDPHLIDVTWSGISPATLASMQAIVGPGVQLVRGVTEAPPEQSTQFADLKAAMTFWQPLAPGRGEPPAAGDDAGPPLHANSQQLDSLLNFFGRLRGTADYENVRSRPLLAQRVLDLTAQLASSESLAALCHERIEQALESCGDRVSWAMNQIELAVRVHKALQQEAPQQQLRALGRSLLRLHVVQQHAAAKVGRLRVVDPIEVYLAYETQLVQRLSLPLATQEMLYGRISNVTEEDLATAEKAAQQADADPVQVETFLAAWQPWQAFTRRQQAAACSWQQLPQLPQAIQLDDDQLCILTRETLAEMRANGSPVAALQDALGQWQPYAFAPLLQWWTEQGTHPVLRIPSKLEDMHRVG
jgi:hypothetical protein